MSAALPVTPAPARSFDLAKVHKQILYPRISKLLYNPGDEPVEFTMSARTFVVPANDQMASKEDWLKGMCPHGPGTIEARAWHQATPYPDGAQPGILPLGDFPGIKETVGQHGIVVYRIVSASEQATQATGPNGNDGPLSKRGIRLLSGDPETDAAIIENAQVAWRESIYLSDVMLIKAHEQINAKMTKGFGNPLRPLSPRVRKAYERKLEQDRAGKAARLYECPVCAEQHGSVHDRDTHIVTFHPERAGSLGLGRGTAFDTSGNPIQVDAAGLYGSGATGTVQGYREVTRDAKGNVTGERWVGESHQAAQARISSRAPAPAHTAVTEAMEGTLNEVLETLAAMAARQEQLEAAAGYRQATVAAAPSEPPKTRMRRAAPPEAPTTETKEE